MLADDPDVRAAVDETCRILSTAVDSASPQDVPPELTEHLRSDTFLFSGFKTYHEAREVSALLLDPDTGSFKAFDRFLADVQSINDTYNRSYLNAEYNFAVQSTQMAVRWHDFEQDGDRYLLQYRTANDGLVRPEHQALHNTTLPVSDPFWNAYTPPLGWNCRCTVVQVLQDKYPLSDSAAAIRAGEAATAKPKQRIFRFNPGKTQRVFPPKHPYFPKGCGDCQAGHYRKLAYDPSNPKCQTCRVLTRCLDDKVYERKFTLQSFSSGGIIESYPSVPTDTDDYKRILATATHFAEQGSHVVLGPAFRSPLSCPSYNEIYSALIGTSYYGKCPDICIDGIWYEHEGFTTKNPKNALRNMLTHGLKQSSRIIIEDPLLTDYYIRNSIENRQKTGAMGLQ